MGPIRTFATRGDLNRLLLIKTAARAKRESFNMTRVAGIIKNIMSFGFIICTPQLSFVVTATPVVFAVRGVSMGSADQ
jgi:hypothetical protein